VAVSKGGRPRKKKGEKTRRKLIAREERAQRKGRETVGKEFWEGKE